MHGHVKRVEGTSALVAPTFGLASCCRHHYRYIPESVAPTKIGKVGISEQTELEVYNVTASCLQRLYHMECVCREQISRWRAGTERGEGAREIDKHGSPPTKSAASLPVVSFIFFSSLTLPILTASRYGTAAAMGCVRPCSGSGVSRGGGGRGPRSRALRERTVYVPRGFGDRRLCSSIS